MLFQTFKDYIGLEEIKENRMEWNEMEVPGSREPFLF